MKVGDLVVRKSYGKDITFKIIDIKDEDNDKKVLLKGINIRIIADCNIGDLEVTDDESSGTKDKILNTRVESAIKSAVMLRGEVANKVDKITKQKTNKEEMKFGRPGRILHLDGDSEYMETCLKVYKQLSLDAIGKAVPEKEQPVVAIDLVKEFKPDIVVLTGHDSILKDPKDYLNLKNYRNSKYYLEAVKKLRDYNSSYDELVIFAGACQSCYEKILDAGANFASSPSRVLTHCLDPVFVCERIAYTHINKIVSVEDVVECTITGIKGVGGLETRGKFRAGYPKSSYI